jgi:ABC-type multidrug transport system fused ATPase/permease subunit
MYAAGLLLLAGIIVTPLLLILFSRFQAQSIKINDTRLKLIREIFSSIKYLKLKSLEPYFQSQITSVRSSQLVQIQGQLWSINIFIVIVQSIPMLMPVVTLITYATNAENEFRADIIFPAVVFFWMLFQPLQSLAGMLGAVLTGMVSWGRIKGFLCGDEREPVKRHDDDDDDVDHEGAASDLDKVAVRMVGASFKWEGSPEKEKKVDQEDEKENEKDKDGDGDVGEDGGEDDKKDKKKGKKEKKNKKAKKEAEQTEPVIKEPTLKDINLSIPRGSLTVIVGTVGSGKSSLLSAITGDMTYVPSEESKFSLHPTIVENGIALCLQQPWLMSTTLKNNITFNNKDPSTTTHLSTTESSTNLISSTNEHHHHHHHQHHKEESDDMSKLKNILKATALTRDLKSFENGIHTELGEKGISLSGGQKARVALARACYASDTTDLYLLDDPLAALDVHVGKHVFYECIKGYLKDKTRVLVTHQLQYLGECDWVVVLEDGKVVEEGRYEDLMKKNKGGEVDGEGAEEGKLQGLMKEFMVSCKSFSFFVLFSFFPCPFFIVVVVVFVVFVVLIRR